MTRLLPILILLAVAGCKSGGSRDWYNGPAELKQATEAAINTARAELSQELNRPLKWDWSRNRVTLLIQEPTAHVRGLPQIPHPDGLVGGYATPSSITLPRGFRRPSLVHEEPWRIPRPPEHDINRDIVS